MHACSANVSAVFNPVKCCMYSSARMKTLWGRRCGGGFSPDNCVLQILEQCSVKHLNEFKLDELFI